MEGNIAQRQGETGMKVTQGKMRDEDIKEMQKIIWQKNK